MTDWDTYLVLKICKQGVRIVAINLSVKEKVNIVGNLPELYHGMTIKIQAERREEYDNTYKTLKCIDYELSLTPKNVAQLEKKEIDVEKYGRILNVHKQFKDEGLVWKTAATETGLLYSRLPFDRADKIHRLLVDDPNDDARIKAISRKVIETGRAKNKITYGIDEYLTMFDDIEKQGAYSKLTVIQKLKCLESDNYGLSKNNIFDAEMQKKDDFVIKNIKERVTNERDFLKQEEIDDFVNALRKSSKLAEEQLCVLNCLIDNLPCIVTGGAGTGKTSIIKAILDCYAKYHGKKGILLLAPTGKASRRLAEKTKYEAGTIHRALRKCPDDNFVYYNEKKRLPYRLIVIDESSMIDTALMYDLLKATDYRAKLIFVGDHNQLSPVGYGEPFKDFFDFLEVFNLTENHRQEEGTDILQNAAAVLEGKGIKSGRGITVKHIAFQEIEGILDATGRDKNVQFISPYNNLNNQINDYLRISSKYNADDELLAEEITDGLYAPNKFSVGDKVMTIRNAEKYCNGDVGYISRIAQSGNITVNIDGRSVCIKKSDIKDLTFAYAITVHKMQGSESDKVIVFIPENDGLMDRHMLYTAITRARKELEIYYYSISS